MPWIQSTTETDRRWSDEAARRAMKKPYCVKCAESCALAMNADGWVHSDCCGADVCECDVSEPEHEDKNDE